MDLFKFHSKPETLDGHHEADDIVPEKVKTYIRNMRKESDKIPEKNSKQ